MRKLVLSGVLAILASVPAFATCPTPPSGPSCAGGICWFVYSPDPSCLDTYNVSTTSTSCSSGYEYGSGSSYISYTFTIGANDPNTGWIDMQAYVDFDDPNNNSTTIVQGYAYVIHNGVGSFHSLWYHRGDEGDLSCESLYGGVATSRGDTISVSIEAYNPNGAATIKTANMFVYTWYHQ